MTKTELRKELTRATNSARNLKNKGLEAKYEWHADYLRETARDLREAASAIDRYIAERR